MESSTHSLVLSQCQCPDPGLKHCIRTNKIITYPNLARAGEILPILVETNGHHAIGSEKGLLDTVAMVHVDVNVEHTLVIS